MKNKHLVILFLVVLGVGLLTRRLPWGRAQLFETELVKLDTAEIARLSVGLPGHPEISLVRTENGWAAAQEKRSVAVASAAIDTMLTALSSIWSIRIVKSRTPDSLGLGVNNRILLDLYKKEEEPAERLYFGHETMENGMAATYVQVGEHDGIYLVKGHLRRLFSRSPDDFRKHSVAVFEPLAIDSFVLNWPDGGRYRFARMDTNLTWSVTGDSLPAVPDSLVQPWLASFKQLNKSHFADHFDESRIAETRLGWIALFQNGEEIRLDFFHLDRPELPEEPEPASGRPDLLTADVLHSSQNPLNYFALADTALTRRLCFGLRPHTTLNPLPIHENGAKTRR